MEKIKVNKPGREWYIRQGYKKGLLIYVKPDTHRKLKKLANEKGFTVQELLRGKIEKLVN